MSQLRAVLFDVDGVLLDSTLANAAFYRELFRQIGGLGPTDMEMTKHNHLSVEAMLRRYYPDSPEHDINTWAALADTIDAGFDLLKPMLGASEIIPMLARGYKLGLVTNRRASGIEELWQVLPFQALFSSVASYEKTVGHKPDPEPVLFALNELGVDPSAAVFVGDAQTDLQAGQAAGVDVVILGQKQWPGVFATINSLSELPMVLTNRP